MQQYDDLERPRNVIGALMKKVVAVAAIFAGCFAVWTGLRDARSRQNDGPQVVVAEFLNAFLAGDQTAMRRLSDPESPIEFTTDAMSAIDGVTYRVRSTNRENDTATSKFTLAADKDFVRGEIFMIQRHGQWFVQSLDFDNRTRERDTVDELDQLNGLEGVTISPL